MQLVEKRNDDGQWVMLIAFHSDDFSSNLTEVHRFLLLNCLKRKTRVHQKILGFKPRISEVEEQPLCPLCLFFVLTFLFLCRKARIWTLNRWLLYHHNLCDQIGWFLKVLGSKFSYKSNTSIGITSWTISKNITFSKNNFCIYF